MYLIIIDKVVIYMSTIQKTFKTSKTANEMKQMAEKIIKDVPIISSVVDKMEWQGNKLCISAKIGEGYLEVLDFAVKVDINLNFMGSMAKGQIESMLDQQFFKLEDKNTQ